MVITSCTTVAYKKKAVKSIDFRLQINRHMDCTNIQRILRAACQNWNIFQLDTWMSNGLRRIATVAT
jgi:hypothetical protein